MRFYFALFHLNKCYQHHRLNWKKFMKTKNSVPICLRSKVQLTGTNMRENLFSSWGERETSFPYIESGNWLWLRLRGDFWKDPGIWRVECDLTLFKDYLENLGNFTLSSWYINIFHPSMTVRIKRVNSSIRSLMQTLGVRRRSRFCDSYLSYLRFSMKKRFVFFSDHFP